MAALAGLSLTFLYLCGTVEAISCKQCHDIVNPSDCKTDIKCGKGEVCLTEEFTNYNGLRAYRLGCMNAQRCKLLTDATSIVGKRQLATQCYKCCDKDGCNADQCQDYVTTKGPHHVTTQTPSTENPGCTSKTDTTICPDLFTPFMGSCYFVPPGLFSWTICQEVCRQHGANLVSINSIPEYDFLRNWTARINVNNIDCYYTGASYSGKIGNFTYMDGSPFSFSTWSPDHGYPHVEDGFRVAFINPARDLYYNLMYASAGTSNCGFICETHKK